MLNLEDLHPRMLGRCVMCQEPVYEDKFQHINNQYFCPVPKKCVSKFFEAEMEEKNVQVEG